MKRATRILIVGRPNVGKSSLMNALLGYRRSIVCDVAGTTQDALIEKVEWDGVSLELSDAQGIYGEEDREVLENLLTEADACLFLVDHRSGILPFDRWLAKEIRRKQIPSLLCVNKAEGQDESVVLEFSELAFEEAVHFSAAHRQNLNSLKEWCIRQPQQSEPTESTVSDVTIAILGRPNVGKSTLMNRLCGRAVSKVSPIAMTTRDPVSAVVESGGTRFRLLDTAGIRRRRSRDEPIEVFSVQASKRAMREANIVFLLLNASEALTEQDKRLLSLVEDAGKPTVIFANFWDKLKGEERKLFLQELSYYPGLQHYPVEPISAASGKNLDKCLEWASKLAGNLSRRISTSVLNARVKEIVAKNPPPARGKGRFNLLYVSQIKESPPTFVFFGNRKNAVTENYQRFLKNELRREFGFFGQPIRLYMRENKGKESRK